MKSSQSRVALLATLIIIALSAAAAPAVTIRFQVRMGQQMALGNFDPGAGFVDLAGSFNGWGTNPLTPLSDADGDSIYEATLDGFTPGETIEYKFRYDGQWDGTEEFPGVGSNRVYTVLDDANEILVWYNDQPPYDLGGELHWWNDTVFYEIFVRSFQDSDGDGIGDLAGLTQRLDYLNDGDPRTDTDLGITGIWLMPINDSPSYHGYDSTDYHSINPDYGTLAEFETFLAAAHARGIKVIIDYVMNHCASQHPWFQAALAGDPNYRDRFRWSASDPGQTGPWGQNVWHNSAGGWYYGLFWSGMPDLNYDNPVVKAEMFDTAGWWLDTVGVDGFRLDAVLYIDEDGGQLQNTPGTLQFWQDYNTAVKAVNPDVLSVGEAWTSSGTVLQYVTNERLDICFEFDLSYATVGAANDGDAGYLAQKASQVYAMYPHLQFATFLTNHDQNRVFESLGQDEGKAKVAAGIYLTLPGVPFVYYGEEVGMIGSGADEFKRTPMQWTGAPGVGFTTGTPWQAPNGNFAQYNVQGEDQDQGSLLNWYRRLIQLRGRTPALRRGTHTALASSAAPVLGFLRSDGPQTVLCLANTAPDSQFGVVLTGGPGGLLPGDYALTNLLDPADTPVLSVDSAFGFTGLDLAGYEVAVYEIVSVSGIANDGDAVPRAGLRLEQNHPNPFNPATTIRYRLPAAGRARLAVYDVAGRELTVLLDGAQDAGAHQVTWRGEDRSGRAVGAGVYFVRIDAGGETRLVKMTLVK